MLLNADDSLEKHISDVEKALSNDLHSVCQWLVDNKLSLHLGKTESILFGTKHKLHSKSNLQISCNDTSISTTSSVKYHGVTIDQFLPLKIWLKQFKKLMLERDFYTVKKISLV